MLTSIPCPGLRGGFTISTLPSSERADQTLGRDAPDLKDIWGWAYYSFCERCSLTCWVKKTELELNVASVATDSTESLPTQALHDHDSVYRHFVSQL